ncbi:hypothetical protein [uncultured Alistipes sp.]|uniref:hypothetical protein n=1 Tax=uncultured Alistipes sp. TaxID=538949 RepID=UPI002803CEC7|nr:hypothetical protein [uncultured Alistipes sp.]
MSAEVLKQKSKLEIRKQMWKKQGVFPIFFAQEGVAAAVRSNCGAQECDALPEASYPS